MFMLIYTKILTFNIIWQLRNLQKYTFLLPSNFRDLSKNIYNYLIICLKKMNKKPSIRTNSPSSNEQSYEVEKIVNQKVINGKKQYKVIWAGYSFQDATWEPQQNLNCPEKINEFLRRYQEVLKKKNLLKQNSNPGMPQSNLQVQKAKSLEPPQKINIEKYLPTSNPPQKLPVNQSSNLNKEKLQASMQKNATNNQKKPTNIQNLKEKIMGAQLNPTVKPINGQNKLNANTYQTFSNDQIKSAPKIPLPSQSAQNQNISGKISISKQIQNKPSSNQINLGKQNPSKVIKIQNQSQKLQNLQRPSHKIEAIIQKLPAVNQSQVSVIRRPCDRNQMDTMRRVRMDDFTIGQNSQERKISSIQYEQQVINEVTTSQNKEEEIIFMKNQERLDIQAIYGVNYFGQGLFEDRNIANLSLEKGPYFFTIKNKYCENEKLVERERIISEQPLRLIEYYEDLLMQSMSA